MFIFFILQHLKYYHREFKLFHCSKTKLFMFSRQENTFLFKYETRNFRRLQMFIYVNLKRRQLGLRKR